METIAPTASTSSVALRYGLILGLVWVIIDFLLRQIGFSFLSYFTITFVVALLVNIIAIVIAHSAFKKANAGLMSYGQGLFIGVAMVLIWGIVSTVFSYAYVNFIDAGFVDQIRDEMVSFMEQNGVPQTEIDKSTVRFDEMKGSFGKTLISGLSSGLVMGVILSLVISIFTKRKHSEFE